MGLWCFLCILLRLALKELEKGGQRYSFDSHLGLRRGAYGRQLHLGQGWVTYVTRRILGLIDSVKNLKTFLGPIWFAFVLYNLMRRGGAHLWDVLGDSWLPGD